MSPLSLVGGRAPTTAASACLISGPACAVSSSRRYASPCNHCVVAMAATRCAGGKCSAMARAACAFAMVWCGSTIIAALASAIIASKLAVAEELGAATAGAAAIPTASISAARNDASVREEMIQPIASYPASRSVKAALSTELRSGTLPEAGGAREHRLGLLFGCRGLVGGEEVAERGDRQRAAEQIALHHVAAHHGEQRHRRLRLDALGGDLHLLCLCLVV